MEVPMIFKNYCAVKSRAWVRKENDLWIMSSANSRPLEKLQRTKAKSRMPPKAFGDRSRAQLHRSVGSLATGQSLLSPWGDG